jgi:thymidine kinase
MLYLILGPMFSSKTTELIRQYNRNSIGGKKCIMIKYMGDDRYDADSVVTHDGIKVDAIKCKYLKDFEHIVKDYDVICVDEVQFYPDADIYCDLWAMDKQVYACGLSGTFKRTPFPIISNLIAKADKIKFLTAICKENGNEAPFTKINNDLETGDKIEIIGGSEKYKAVDRKKYFD